jgi:UDP-N-acetyl-D-glucosamine dehydrogenase
VSQSPGTLAALLQRIARREARVGIVGMGYVGLPLALLFSESGFAVTGFDIDPAKVEQLNRGESYIQRIDAAQIDAARARGFRATEDFANAAEMDAMLICVPTPLQDDKTPDLSFVAATVEALAPHLRAGQMVVLESTSYPGTTEEIVAAVIDRSGPARVLRQSGDAELLDGVLVAFSPEREDPGNPMPRREIPKVLGGVDARATRAAEALYGAVFERTIAMSSPAAAEMTKLLENIYRCVNIALVNELKQLCLRMGLDLWEVIEAAATKPFGFQAFYPGPGVGGHCIPVDPFYLSWKAEQFGFKTRFIELAGEVNAAMPGFVVETVERALADRGIKLEGASVLVLGVAYKRDLDDLRESPALSILETLRQRGARIAYNDPYFPAVGSGRHYHLHLQSTPLERVGEFDCVLLVTDHSSYELKSIVERARLVVDSRNATRFIDSPKIVRC